MKILLLFVLMISCTLVMAKDKKTVKRIPSNIAYSTDTVLFNCTVQHLRVEINEVAGYFNCSSKPYQETRDVIRGFEVKHPDLKNALIAASFNKLPVDISGEVEEDSESKRLLITNIQYNK